MMTLEEIKDKIKEIKPEISKLYGVHEISIFGSYVSGNADQDSDVDILVEFNRPIDYFLFLELEEFISDVLNIKVDLVEKKALKPNIGKFIINEMIII